MAVCYNRLMSTSIIKRSCFTIRRPIGARRTYAVLKDIIYLDGRRAQSTLEDPRIDAVNLNMQRGLLSQDEAYLHLRDSIVPALKAEAGISEKKRNADKLSDVNRRVLDKFYQERYEHGELLQRSKDAAWDLLSHALHDIEPLPITTATLKQLRDKLADKKAHTQRRHVIGLNQLLKFLGRDIRLEKRRRESREVQYITWADLQAVLPHIVSPEVQALAIALFGTGVRLGEAFVPGFCQLLPKDSIFIRKQLARDGEEFVVRDIKNRRPHRTTLLPEAKPGYLEWCQVPDKQRFRHSAINQIINAARKAFPNHPAKHISPHDLRHSFAIHLAGKGASVKQLAGLLGDSYSTVELHYTGHILSDDEIDNVRRLVDKSA
jgi:integrase